MLPDDNKYLIATLETMSGYYLISHSDVSCFQTKAIVACVEKKRKEI